MESYVCILGDKCGTLQLARLCRKYFRYLQSNLLPSLSQIHTLRAGFHHPMQKESWKAIGQSGFIANSRREAACAHPCLVKQGQLPQGYGLF